MYSAITVLYDVFLLKGRKDLRYRHPLNAKLLREKVVSKRKNWTIRCGVDGLVTTGPISAQLNETDYANGYHCRTE